MRILPIHHKKLNTMELSFIGSKIFTIRYQSVMLDRDLAELYGVEMRVLNQAVKRNINRFPEDYMFRLTESEFQSWKSQIVITNSLKNGFTSASLCFYRSWGGYAQ